VPPPGYRPLGTPTAGESKPAGRRGLRIGGRSESPPPSDEPAEPPAADEAPPVAGDAPGPLGGIVERLRALLRRGR
jgi:hypothetical protein